MAFASRRGGAVGSSLLFALFISLLIGGGRAAASPGAEAPQAIAAAARWALPPANVARRAALLGAPSAMEQVLSAQGAPVRKAVGGGLPDFPARTPDVAAPGAPNVFGSVALAVSATPLDAQWRSAQSAPVPAAARAAFASLDTVDDEALIGAVNRWVNGRLTFTDDQRLSGRADRWSGAAESLRRGRGDCEDYAIAKMQILRALGYDASDLFLVVVRDLARRADHAVLVVRAGSRYLVLDNMTDRVVDSNSVRDYRPVFSFSANGRWLHGNARPVQPATLQMAAALVASGPVLPAFIFP